MRACVHSVDVLVSVVKRHASGEVQCNVVISVVIGVHVSLLVPLESGVGRVKERQPRGFPWRWCERCKTQLESYEYE